MESIIHIVGETSLTTLLVFVAVFLLCFSALSKSHLPPGPLKFPVIGSVWWFITRTGKKTRLPLEFMKEAQKYGDVMHFKFFSEHFVVLTGYDAINEAFVKRANDFSARPGRLFDAIQDDVKGVGGSSGKIWRVLRKFAVQAMKDLGVGKASVEERIFVEVDAATEYLKKTNGKPTNVRQMASMIVTNVTYGLLFGKRFDFSDTTLHQIIHNLNINFQAGAPLDISSHIPTFVWRLLGNKEKAEAPAINARAGKWVQTHVTKEIKEHEECYDETNIRDFVDMFIKVKQTESEYKQFTTKHLFYVIQDLFMAGSETSANAINWVILFMQEYPDVQDRCREEIMQEVGERPVRWADKAKLPYVEATMVEVLRLANIVEMSVPHTNLEETTFRGYRIPKDSIIEANLISSNKDTKYFDEPENFNPDRFLKNGKYTVNPALVPFSVGPRACLGDNLALMEIFLCFTNFLQRFTFKREFQNEKHTFECDSMNVTSVPQTYRTRPMYRC